MPKTSPGFIRIIRSHPRLYSALVIGFSVGMLGPLLGIQALVTRVIVGYDVGAVVYIIWAGQLIFFANKEKMRKMALLQDDGKFVVLVLVVVALVCCIGAIFAELSLVKHLEGTEKMEQLLLAFFTIVASWFFTNTVYALHYAHEYYFAVQNGEVGGLEFHPSEAEPEYLDFLYFSFVVGATAQTSDVTLSSKRMRRILLSHSVLAFFFNTAILALTVNMAAGLL